SRRNPLHLRPDRAAVHPGPRRGSDHRRAQARVGCGVKRGPIELYVGLFAMAAVAILVFFTIKVGSSSLGKQYSVPMTVSFVRAAGVGVRTRVRFAGDKAGEGGAIRIENRRAKLTLMIAPGVFVPDDTRAEIRTQGLIGETYIQLQA